MASQSTKRAFIIGYSGEVGSELVKTLVEMKAFSKLVLIGRKTLQYDDANLQSLEQKVVDFDKLDNFKETFENFDVGFCTLGTTRAKAGAEGFYKVDHDYVLQSAKLAKENGCQEFHLLTSSGANKNSMFLYMKTKGEVEENVSKLQFKNLSIYRPKMLLCNRKESRFGESIARFLMKPINAISPTALSITTVDAARAMAKNSLIATEQPIRIFENVDMHNMSKNV